MSPPRSAMAPCPTRSSVMHGAIALRSGDIDDRLGQKQLRERRHHDRPAQLFAHAAQLFDHSGLEVRKPDLRNVSSHGAHHSPWQLMMEIACVKSLWLT